MTHVLALPTTVMGITCTPLTLTYNAISEADTQNAAYNALVPGGMLVVMLTDVVDKDTRDASKSVVHVFGSVQPTGNCDVGKPLYAVLTGLLAVGDVKVRVLKERIL